MTYQGPGRLGMWRTTRLSCGGWVARRWSVWAGERTLHHLDSGRAFWLSGLLNGSLVWWHAVWLAGWLIRRSSACLIERTYYHLD